MKKALAILLTCILSIGLLCSCGNSKAAPDGMKVLESSDKLPYNLYIPAAWTQDLSTGAVSAYFSSSDLSNISMSQFNLEELDTLENRVNKYIDELKNNLADVKISEGYPQNTLLGKVAAQKLEYTAKLAGDTYKYMQIICINGSTIYFFTYTSTEDNFDKHTDEVQKMLDNFSFKNVK